MEFIRKWAKFLYIHLHSSEMENEANEERKKKNKLKFQQIFHLIANECRFLITRANNIPNAMNTRKLLKKLVFFILHRCCLGTIHNNGKNLPQSNE